MPASTSELRQLASSPLSFTPSHAEISPACKLAASTDQELQSASKARRGRRKVLADLAGNDSPIVGLIPGLLNCAARTPASCEFKSAMGTQNCASKKPLIPPTDQESSDTPLGESLLRSQVKLLLQKVESDAPTIHRPAPSLRALCHLHTFMDSPALKLVAPTPVNTPCGNISPHVPAPTPGSMSDLFDSTVQGSNDQVQVLVQTSYRQEKDQHRPNVQKVQVSGIKLLVDLHISPEGEAVAPSEQLPLQSKASETGHITITESVLSGRDHHVMQVSPLISEAYDEADILALGKKTTRILQFDSPDKVSFPDQLMSVTSPETKEGLRSSVRELEEDEVSEWSILVNVSSPDRTGRRDVEAELYEEDSADSSNLDLNQKTPVWTSCRRGTPYPKGTFTGDADDDDEQGDDIEASEEDGAEYKHSQGEEAYSKLGLPVAEGKHIRFSYDSDDEIV